MIEHDYEPVPGLPAHLPAGERILWQGAPDRMSLFRRAYRASAVGVYFVLLMLWRAADVLTDGGSLGQALVSAAWMLPLAAAALALLALFAWASSRTTLYTLTDRRVVMRVGIALSKTFNLPFAAVDTAALAAHADGTGDIALVLSKPNRIGYMHLWPHVRPWHLMDPQPTLRCVADAATLAETLAGAMTADLARRQGATAAGSPVATTDNAPKTAPYGGYETKAQARGGPKFATMEA